MGGRADYEERKQKRIERYKVLSQKAKAESEARSNSTANRILMMTPRTTYNSRSSFRKESKKIARKSI